MSDDRKSRPENPTGSSAWRAPKKSHKRFKRDDAANEMALKMSYEKKWNDGASCSYEMTLKGIAHDWNSPCSSNAPVSNTENVKMPAFVQKRKMLDPGLLSKRFHYNNENDIMEEIIDSDEHQTPEDENDGQAKEEIIYDEQTSATGLISSINIISFNNYEIEKMEVDNENSKTVDKQAEVNKQDEFIKKMEEILSKKPERFVIQGEYNCRLRFMEPYAPKLENVEEKDE